jgi:hypothetical protein
MLHATRHPLSTLRGALDELGQAAGVLAGEVREALEPARTPLEGLWRLELLVIKRLAARLERLARARSDRLGEPLPRTSWAAGAAPQGTAPVNGSGKAGAAPESAEADLAAVLANAADAAMAAVARKSEPPPSLKQQFRRLLDRSLEPKSAGEGIDHPSFRQILEQLVPDEALMLSLFARRGHLPLLDIQAGPRLGWNGKTVFEHFSSIGETVGVRHPELVPSYVENLRRLGLVRIMDADPDERDVYELLEAHPAAEAVRRRITEEMKLTPRFRRRMARLTAFGKSFCKACEA